MKGLKAGQAVHIGDGAYLFFDGCGFELRANNHEFPTDRVYIDRGEPTRLLVELIQATLSEVAASA